MPAAAASPQPEGHVLRRRQVGKQAPVLEHHANRPIRCGHAYSARRVLEHLAIENNLAVVQRPRQTAIDAARVMHASG